MRERYVWAVVAATALLAYACGASFEAVAGTFTFAAAISWVVIEFWNVKRWVSRKLHQHADEDGVTRTLGLMFRDDTPEYGATRNAKQHRGR